MGIANIGSFAGGLMRGHLAATEEQRRQEDQAFQNEQRGIWREDQARLKRIREGIAGIARPGQEIGRSEYVMDGIDGPETLPGAYNVTRQTGEGFQRGLADLYYREGAPELGAAAEDRIQTLSDRARTNRLNERTDRQTAAVDAALLKRADMLKELATDEDAFVAKYGDLFNRDEFGGPQHKGARLAFASTPQGKVGYYIGADGTVGGQFPVNRQSLMEIVNQLTDADLSAASPEQFSAAQARGIQRGQLSAQQTTANAAMRNAATNEAWRQFQESQPRLTPDGRGQVFVTDAKGNLLRTLGVRAQDPGMAALTRPTVRTATLNVPDPATGKSSKVPVNVVTQMGENSVPVVKAYTMDGKLITDNKLLEQLAGGENPNTPDDPRMATFQALRQNVVTNTTLDPVAKMEQLSQIDAQQSLYILQRDVPKLKPEERIPELRKLLKGGVDRKILQGVGFSLAELREAAKPEPLSQQKSGASAGGTATAAAAPAATNTGGIETTKTPEGKTVYRVVGGDRWYPTRAEAQRAETTMLNRQREETPEGTPMGLNRGY